MKTDSTGLQWAAEDEIPDPNQPTPIPAYYDVGGKDYWIKNNRGDWIRVNESALRRHLQGHGYQVKPAFGEFLSPLNQRLNQIQHEFDVVYAGPLAGHQAGFIEVCGKGVLVTCSPKLIEAREGDWSILQKFINKLFYEAELPYVLGWLKIAYESLRDEGRRPGQALVLAGERNSGKSFFQKIVTEILGGRVAKPYRYMSGATDFNGELFGAEHLCIEDEVGSTDIRARRHFGARIKDFIANEQQSCHAKNRQALTLRPLWRISISLNEEPECMLVLPPLDDSVEDKILLLRVRKAEMPMPTFTLEERQSYWKTIQAELPAFIYHLTHWEIPEGLRCARFGIKTFHNSDLLEALDELTPETKLLAVIDLWFGDSKSSETSFEGTAEDLQQRLELGCPRGLRQMLTHPGAMGAYLGRLARKHPDRVRNTRTSTKRTWRITPPTTKG